MSKRLPCPSCHELIDPNLEECPHCDQEFCPECSGPLSENATRCHTCGAEFALLCFKCEEEVQPGDSVCPHCHVQLDEDGDEEANSQDDDTSPIINCPNCSHELIPGDGYCLACGALVCPVCAQLIDEDDENCPHCNIQLYFDCPACQFELSYGTDQCPECDVILPNYCTNCRAKLQNGEVVCPTCNHTMRIIKRKTGRILHAFAINMDIVQIVACPSCGKSFRLDSENCPKCDFRLCATCQIHLEDDESFCPRCGPILKLAGNKTESQIACPSCKETIPSGSDECPHCHQLLCPECHAPVADEDIECPKCGAEFELLCPQCDAVVDAEAAVCAVCELVF